MPLRALLALILLFGNPGIAWSFTPEVDPFVTEAAAEKQRISTLEPGDERKLVAQRQAIDELAASTLGRHLSGTRDNDLDILQALLDKNVVSRTDSYRLQAMGVVLGDIYAHEFGMHWVVYEDEKGKSRALQLGTSNDALFPVTMISRRVETGAHVDVRAVYEKGAGIIKAHQGLRY